TGRRRGCLLPGRSCRSCASGGRRRRIFHLCRCARPDIRKIRSHTHFSEKHLSLKNIIARRAPAVTPVPFDVVGGVIGADLLTVTIDAAVRSINAPAPLGHSRLRPWISVGAVFFHLRIETADLPIWDHGQSDPREG